MHETENKLGVVVIVFYSVKQYRWHGNFLDFRKLGFHTREISHTCLLVKVTTRNCAQLFCPCPFGFFLLLLVLACHFVLSQMVVFHQSDRPAHLHGD